MCTEAPKVLISVWIVSYCINSITLHRDAQTSAYISILEFSLYAYSFLKVIPEIFVLKAIR